MKTRLKGRLARLAHSRTVVVTAVALLAWAAGEGIAAAAEPDSSGGVLGPLHVNSSEGVPLDHYELDPLEQAQAVRRDAPEDQDPAAVGTSTAGIGAMVRNFLASGLFALSRTVTGFACWVIDQVYHFPIIDKLAGPAERISASYETNIIGPLGIAGITLAWAFVFGLTLVMRGKVARGAGELLLSLLISAIAATTVVQPAVILGYDGPVQQTQRAALEAAVITTEAGNAGPKVITGPCALVHGAGRDYCLEQEKERAAAAAERDRAKNCDLLMGIARDTCLSGERVLKPADVSKPITNTLTDSLVVQPYMLLQYGRVLEKDDPLYKAHQKLITSDRRIPEGDANPCRKLSTQARRVCENQFTSGNPGFDELEKAGPEGQAVMQRMTDPDWDKVLGALLVLIAAIIIALVVVAMAFALIAAQFGCVIAAIGAVAVFPLAILPGPGRGVLWKWLGYLAGCLLVLVATAIFIPLFGIAAKAVLASSHSSLLERLLLLDGLVLTALVMYKRIVRGSRTVGARLAQRMSYAKIGGGHFMGGQAAETAAAFSALGIGGTHGSAAHATLLGRSGFAAEAADAARASLAPFRLGLKTAHTVLIGPKRPRVKPAAVGPDGKPLPPTDPKEKPTTVGPDGKPLPTTKPKETVGPDGSPLPPTKPKREPATGAPPPETPPGPPTSSPSDAPNDSPATPQGVVPAGARLEAALRTTRAGRVLATTSKFAYRSTIGLPSTWNRAARAAGTRAGALGTELGRQREHYQGVGRRWASDSRAGLGLGRPASETTAPEQRPGSTTAPQPAGRTYPATNTSTPAPAVPAGMAASVPVGTPARPTTPPRPTAPPLPTASPTPPTSPGSSS
ncbi:hypothetical protein ACFCZ6_14125 [Streptomyces hydrogenans]|uniref:hypothetical protein n=1 Tax=Streptomyces hydrogenans TaxID=1873719 RepID=UPI0035D806D2